ncbi:MAG: hypothetical protein IJJ26_11810 [Victivallales bacterium]|nr:hypothetical protein [Victivallales bacterium]
MRDFLSIDQNCNGLWDTVPKLAALHVHGLSGVHYLEDVDMAYTRHGAKVGDALAMERERFYRGGVSDWGAAYFYTDLLGAQPWDLSEFSNCLGMSLAALAKKLGTNVDALYDRWSPSGNWQLTGPSFLPDGTHRVIGDLTIGELAPQLRWLLQHAREDVATRFPEPEAQARAEAWFATSRQLMESHLSSKPGESLTDFYASWLRQDLGEALPSLTLTSELFAWKRENAGSHVLLATFLHDYPTMRDCYNRSLLEAHSPLHPLLEGELPFFVIYRRDGRMSRVTAKYQDGCLLAGGQAWDLSSPQEEWPWEEMRSSGIVAIAGKAVVLVNMVRGANGTALALPRLGSLYMPAGHAFARNLASIGAYQVAHPVLRVRFRFLERWQNCRTLVALPEDLTQITGIDCAPAHEIAENLLSCMLQADKTLQVLASPETRQTLLTERFSSEQNQLQLLAQRKREIATQGGDGYRQVLAELRRSETALLEKQMKWIADLVRLRDLTFFDSRGALLPWSLALGGRQFYETLLRQSEITQER